MNKQQLKIFLPNGSLQDVVEQLFRDAGLPVSYGKKRSYLGSLSSVYLNKMVDVVVSQFRPWDMPFYIANGSAHLAVTADDMIWNAGLLEDERITVLDHYPIARQGYSKTRLVIAVPNNSPIQRYKQLTVSRPMMPGTDRKSLVTEYYEGATIWAHKEGMDLEIINCHGKLEAFRHFELADAILENTESGDTLFENHWRVIHQIMESQTCLIANEKALADKTLGPTIKIIKRMLASVIAARKHFMIEFNVTKKAFKDVKTILLGYSGYLEKGQSPTISNLLNGDYEIKVVIPCNKLEDLLDRLDRRGVSSIATKKCDHYIP